MSSLEQDLPVDCRKLVGRGTARALLLFQDVKAGIAAVIVAMGLAAIMSYRSAGPSGSPRVGGPQVPGTAPGPAAAYDPAAGATDGPVSTPASTSVRLAKRSSDRARSAEVAAAPAIPAAVVVPPPIPPPPTPAPMAPASLSLATTPPPVAAPIQTPGTPSTAKGTKPKPGELIVNVNKDAVIGIRLDRTVSTDTARVDDKVSARVSRDVVVEGRTAIPAGARLEGVVTLVERSGPSNERDRLGIRFNVLVLSGNTRVPIQTDTIFRDSEKGEAMAAQGASAALGARVSGGRPGSPANATGRAPFRIIGAGTADARIPGGSPLTVRLTAPLSIAKGQT